MARSLGGGAVPGGFENAMISCRDGSPIELGEEEGCLFRVCIVMMTVLGGLVGRKPDAWRERLGARTFQ